MNAGERIAKGDDVTSLWLYNKLTNDRSYLAGLSDDQFYALRTSLSGQDFEHFSKERAKLNGSAGGGSGAGDLNSAAIKQGLDSRLRMLNIDPTPNDTNGNARIGAMRQFVNRYFLTAQHEAGKKFTDAEVEQHLDTLFLKSATLRGWFSDTSVPMLTLTVDQLNGATKEGLQAAFRRAGIDAPTDAQMLDAYWSLRAFRK
jgi:soluble lytic murein transglycosylase